MGKLVTTREAASLLGLSSRQVQRLARCEKLPGIETVLGWKFAERDVLYFQKKKVREKRRRATTQSEISS